MKKVFVISAIVIVMSILLLTMTSCGDNPFQRLIQRTSPQEIIAKNVCDAIANRDSQKLYQLFSEEVKMNVPDLKEKTDKLLETYGKDSLEIQTRELSGGSDYHSGEKQSYETTLVTVTTSETEYYLNLNMCIEDTELPENEGIKRIFVYTPEQKTYISFPYTSGDEGICFFSLDEPWYDSNDLQSRPLKMGNDLIDLNPPILLSKGSLLYPLFSLLDALDAAYSQNEADGSIDLVHENKHFRITFPEADNENYQWIALTDLDLERELRLSNSEKYCGLYTVIDGTVYLHQKSGEYLLYHLGYEDYPIKDNIYFVRPKNNTNNKDKS